MARRLLILILSSASAIQAFAGSWPTFHRTLARDGYITEEAAPPLVQRWTFDIPGSVFSSPALAYGRVYIGARNNKLYCLDANTGVVDWTYAAGDWIDAAPTVSGGVVYASSRDGYLYALNAYTGALVWKYATGSKDVSSPAVSNGEVYSVTASPKRKINVLDAKTGAFRRSANLSQFATSTPVLDANSGLVFVGATNGKYSAWNFNMLPQWGRAVQTGGSVSFTTPALANGQLIAAPGDDDWQVHSYDPATGFQLWVSTVLSNSTSIASSIAASTTTFFVGAGAGYSQCYPTDCNSAMALTPYTLYAFTIPPGSTVGAIAWSWSVPLGGANNSPIASSPALANDVVYVMSPQGELYGVSASTGGVLAKMTLNGPSVTSPAVGNGWVYTATIQGRVYGFQAQRAWAVTNPDMMLDSTEGILAVSGTVMSPQLQSYRLEYASSTYGAQWVFLSSGTQNVSNAPLTAWDTRSLFDGLYTLRLTVQEASPSGLTPQALYTLGIPTIKTLSVDPSSMTILSLADGTEVDIPAGALSAADILAIAVPAPGDYTDAGVPETARASSIVRHIRLASSDHPQFRKNVTIKLPYSNVVARNEANLRIYYFDEAGSTWRMVNSSQVKPFEKRVWADLNHFTMFRVMEYAPFGALLDSAQVYAYPNPATGNTVTFKYLLGNKADVKIKIFDVAGHLVASLSRDQAPAGIASTSDWDVSGKASGIYIYEMEANAGGGVRDKIIKKLAIIH